MFRYLTIAILFVGACEPAYAGSPYAVRCAPGYACPPAVYPQTVNNHYAAAASPVDHAAFKVDAVRTLLDISRQKNQLEETAILTQAIEKATFGSSGLPIAAQGTTIYGSYRGYGPVQNPLQTFSAVNPHVYANQLARINEGAQALHSKVIDGGTVLADKELALRKMELALTHAGNLAEKVLRSSEPDQIQQYSTEARASSVQSSTINVGPQAADGSAVLQARCMKCHGKDLPSGGVDFTRMAEFDGEAKQKITAALLQKKMPVAKVGDGYQYTPLPPAELVALLHLFAQ